MSKVHHAIFLFSAFSLAFLLFCGVGVRVGYIVVSHLDSVGASRFASAMFGAAGFYLAAIFWSGFKVVSAQVVVEPEPRDYVALCEGVEAPTPAGRELADKVRMELVSKGLPVLEKGALCAVIERHVRHMRRS